MEDIFSIAKILFVGKANETEFQNRTRANLVLANRSARLATPSGTKHPEKSGQNQWAAVSAAHEMASKKSKSQIVVYLYNQYI